MRHRRLLQIGGRAGRVEKEMGGGAVRCRAEVGKRGREGPRVWHHSSDHRVRMASGGVVEGSSARSQWRRAGEHGRAAGCGQRGAARLTGEAQWQRGLVSEVGCGRERGKRGSAAAGHRSAGPGRTVPDAIQTRF
jgi:hypothetical protein